MEHLHTLVNHFKAQHPDKVFPRATPELYEHIQKTLFPHVLQVVQKDNALFKGYGACEIFPGLEMDGIWDSSDESWKKLHTALIYSLMQGDPKDKISKLMEAFKSMIPGGTAASDEIMQMLEKEETESSISEIFELLVNTKLTSIVGDLVSSIQLDDLGINFDDPQDLLRQMQNPQESEMLQTIMKRAQECLEERVKTGKINPNELKREIEMLRAKFQSTFGKYLNEMIVGQGGNTTGNTAQQIMGNSPEARRARMLARLQRKQQEKSRK